MGYYQGDYFQRPRSQHITRGVMRGDPGFFSFLGGIAKKAAGFIPGVGPIVSTALEAIPTGARSMGRAAGAAIIKHPVLSAAGAAGAAAGATAAVEHFMGGGAAMGHRGFHIEKRGKHAGQFIKNRKMNVCNPRALRRAVRRAHGFAKLAMRTIHLVHPKKKARFGGFKKRRAKR